MTDCKTIYEAQNGYKLVACPCGGTVLVAVPSLGKPQCSCGRKVKRNDR